VFRVFISYSHDNEEHSNRVFELAERLRSHQVTVVIDRDTGPGGPPQGWPAWSQAQVKDADRVLIACTKTYGRRYDLEEDPGEGLGAVTEARVIRQMLYDAGGFNEKFRVILFDEAENRHIPADLAGYHRFLLYKEAGFVELLAWLAGAPPAQVTPSSEQLVVSGWPVADPAYNWPLADRKNEFAFFEQMITGQSSQRILLLKGVSNTGKTVCIAELLAYAKHLKVTGALLDFKGCPLLDDLFETLRLDLGPGILKRAYTANGAARLFELIADLQQLTVPLLLVFDTYQQASAEAQKWLESQLLPRLERAPAVIVVIGGQAVPEHTKYYWNALAEFRELRPIQNVDDWRELITKKWQDSLLQDAHIEGVLAATEGDPGKTFAILESLALQRHKP
jgi:hypothetical protein